MPMKLFKRGKNRENKTTRRNSRRESGIWKGFNWPGFHNWDRESEYVATKLPVTTVTVTSTNKQNEDSNGIWNDFQWPEFQLYEDSIEVSSTMEETQTKTDLKLTSLRTNNLTNEGKKESAKTSVNSEDNNESWSTLRWSEAKPGIGEITTQLVPDKSGWNKFTWVKANVTSLRPLHVSSHEIYFDNDIELNRPSGENFDVTLSNNDLDDIVDNVEKTQETNDEYSKNEKSQIESDLEKEIQEYAITPLLVNKDLLKPGTDTQVIQQNNGFDPDIDGYLSTEKNLLFVEVDTESSDNYFNNNDNVGTSLQEDNKFLPTPFGGNEEELNSEDSIFNSKVTEYSFDEHQESAFESTDVNQFDASPERPFLETPSLTVVPLEKTSPDGENNEGNLNLEELVSEDIIRLTPKNSGSVNNFNEGEIQFSSYLGQATSEELTTLENNEEFPKSQQNFGDKEPDVLKELSKFSPNPLEGSNGDDDNNFLEELSAFTPMALGNREENFLNKLSKFSTSFENNEEYSNIDENKFVNHEDKSSSFTTLSPLVTQLDVENDVSEVYLTTPLEFSSPYLLTEIVEGDDSNFEINTPYRGPISLLKHVDENVSLFEATEMEDTEIDVLLKEQIENINKEVTSLLSQNLLEIDKDLTYNNNEVITPLTSNELNGATVFEKNNVFQQENQKLSTPSVFTQKVDKDHTWENDEEYSEYYEASSSSNQPIETVPIIDKESAESDKTFDSFYVSKENDLNDRQSIETDKKLSYSLSTPNELIGQQVEEATNDQELSELFGSFEETASMGLGATLDKKIHESQDNFSKTNAKGDQHDGTLDQSDEDTTNDQKIPEILDSSEETASIKVESILDNQQDNLNETYTEVIQHESLNIENHKGNNSYQSNSNMQDHKLEEVGNTVNIDDTDKFLDLNDNKDATPHFDHESNSIGINGKSEKHQNLFPGSTEAATKKNPNTKFLDTGEDLKGSFPRLPSTPQTSTLCQRCAEFENVAEEMKGPVEIGNFVPELHQNHETSTLCEICDSNAESERSTNKATATDTTRYHKENNSTPRVHFETSSLCEICDEEKDLRKYTTTAQSKENIVLDFLEGHSRVTTVKTATQTLKEHHTLKPKNKIKFFSKITEVSRLEKGTHGSFQKTSMARKTITPVTSLKDMTNRKHTEATNSIENVKKITKKPNSSENVISVTGVNKETATTFEKIEENRHQSLDEEQENVATTLGLQVVLTSTHASAPLEYLQEVAISTEKVPEEVVYDYNDQKELNDLSSNNDQKLSSDDEFEIDKETESANHGQTFATSDKLKASAEATSSSLQFFEDTSFNKISSEIEEGDEGLSSIRRTVATEQDAVSEELPEEYEDATYNQGDNQISSEPVSTKIIGDKFENNKEIGSAESTTTTFHEETNSRGEEIESNLEPIQTEANFETSDELDENDLTLQETTRKMSPLSEIQNYSEEYEKTSTYNESVYQKSSERQETEIAATVVTAKEYEQREEAISKNTLTFHTTKKEESGDKESKFDLNEDQTNSETLEKVEETQMTIQEDNNSIVETEQSLQATVSEQLLKEHGSSFSYHQQTDEISSRRSQEKVVTSTEVSVGDYVSNSEVISQNSRTFHTKEEEGKSKSLESDFDLNESSTNTETYEEQKETQMTIEENISQTSFAETVKNLPATVLETHEREHEETVTYYQKTYEMSSEPEKETAASTEISVGEDVSNDEAISQNSFIIHTEEEEEKNKRTKSNFDLDENQTNSETSEEQEGTKMTIEENIENNSFAITAQNFSTEVSEQHPISDKISSEPQEEEVTFTEEYVSNDEAILKSSHTFYTEGKEEKSEDTEHNFDLNKNSTNTETSEEQEETQMTVEDIVKSSFAETSQNWPATVSEQRPTEEKSTEPQEKVDFTENVSRDKAISSDSITTALNTESEEVEFNSESTKSKINSEISQEVKLNTTKAVGEIFSTLFEEITHNFHTTISEQSPELYDTNDTNHQISSQKQNQEDAVTRINVEDYESNGKTVPLYPHSETLDENSEDEEAEEVEDNVLDENTTNFETNEESIDTQIFETKPLSTLVPSTIIFRSTITKQAIKENEQSTDYERSEEMISADSVTTELTAFGSKFSNAEAEHETSLKNAVTEPEEPNSSVSDSEMTFVSSYTKKAEDEVNGANLTFEHSMVTISDITSEYSERKGNFLESSEKSTEKIQGNSLETSEELTDEYDNITSKEHFDNFGTKDSPSTIQYEEFTKVSNSNENYEVSKSDFEEGENKNEKNEIEDNTSDDNKNTESNTSEIKITENVQVSEENLKITNSSEEDKLSVDNETQQEVSEIHNEATKIVDQYVYYTNANDFNLSTKKVETSEVNASSEKSYYDNSTEGESRSSEEEGQTQLEFLTTMSKEEEHKAQSMSEAKNTESDEAKFSTTTNEAIVESSTLEWGNERFSITDYSSEKSYYDNSTEGENGSSEEKGQTQLEFLTTISKEKEHKAQSMSEAKNTKRNEAQFSTTTNEAIVESSTLEWGNERFSITDYLQYLTSNEPVTSSQNEYKSSTSTVEPPKWSDFETQISQQRLENNESSLIELEEKTTNSDRADQELKPQFLNDEEGSTKLNTFSNSVNTNQMLSEELTLEYQKDEELEESTEEHREMNSSQPESSSTLYYDDIATTADSGEYYKTDLVEEKESTLWNDKDLLLITELSNNGTSKLTLQDSFTDDRNLNLENESEELKTSYSEVEKPTEDFTEYDELTKKYPYSTVLAPLQETVFKVEYENFSKSAQLRHNKTNIFEADGDDSPIIQDSVRTRRIKTTNRMGISNTLKISTTFMLLLSTVYGNTTQAVQHTTHPSIYINLPVFTPKVTKSTIMQPTSPHALEKTTNKMTFHETKQTESGNKSQCIILYVNGPPGSSKKLNGTKWSGALGTAEILLEPTVPPSSETTSVEMISFKPELPKNIALDGCSKTDFDENKNCFCAVDNLIRALTHDLAKLTSPTTHIDCESFLKVDKGLLIGNDSVPEIRKRRSYMFGVNDGEVKREIVDYSKGFFNEDFRVENTETRIYTLPETKVVIPCLNKNEVVEFNRYMKYSWMFEDKVQIPDDHVIEGNLELDHVLPKDSGNYSCSVTSRLSEKDDEAVQKYYHRLIVMASPFYKIKATIMYSMNKTCDLVDGDVLFNYLPKMFNELLCGFQQKICKTVVRRPRCLNYNNEHLINVTFIVTMNYLQTVLPGLDNNICNINCQMNVYSKLAAILMKNIKMVEQLPVFSNLDWPEVDYVPKKIVKKANEEGDWSTSPILIIACPPGFGVEKKHPRVCVVCPKNSFSMGNESYCKMCPPGQYQPAAGSKSCIICSSPLENAACLRVLYADAEHFKMYIGVAVSSILVMIIVIIYFTSSKRNIPKSNSKISNMFKTPKRPFDLEKGVTEPLLRKENKRRSSNTVPPDPPPPDF